MVGWERSRWEESGAPRTKRKKGASGETSEEMGDLRGNHVRGRGVCESSTQEEHVQASL